MNPALKSILLYIHPLPESILGEIDLYFQEQTFPKNHLLLKEGRPCQYLWFMEKGAARYFHTTEEGKEANVWFSFDQDILASAPSFANQSPTHESIQLMEDSTLFAISFHDFHRLLQKHHTFALWHIKLIEKFYITQIEDRIGDLQFLSAKQRYEKLLLLFPDISNRVSLGHIASYLNITQETLSRIRAGKM
jgi:CRP-like cAMP-binding protein